MFTITYQALSCKQPS
ncbi:hypothetical protein NP493_242g03055 [Ridgeia piscesae]|uniref:Uncharacterized protein n=1 Tax=Ridgeia piscesae TaxID=27915 RepID=A0AAD9NYW2_RIDPI|nr:hypothetical protein NP493_242g03055 [Ridgeia piscesae]